MRPLQIGALARMARLFGRFAAPRWRALVAMSAVSMLAGIVSGIQPLVLAPAIDTALLSKAQPAQSLAELSLNNLGPTLLAALGISATLGALRLLSLVIGLYALVAACSAGLNFAAAHMMRRIRTFIATDIQQALYQHLLSLALPFFVHRRIGELASRFHWDVARTAECFDPVVRGFVESGIQLVIYGFILARTDMTLALSVAALALAHLGATRSIQRQIRERTADSVEGFAAVSALVHETLLSVRVVKSFCAEAFEAARLGKLQERLKRNQLKFSSYASAELPLRELTNALVVAVALFVSYSALASGRLTLPGFVLFVVVARQTIIPFSGINSALLQLNLMVGASRSVLEIFAERPGLEDGDQEAAALDSEIRFLGVSFAYEERLPILTGIDLTIRKGKKVAIVGPSGAGKSTLTDLLLRLQDPQQGLITLDGIDIRRFQQRSYRRLFGVVPQEALLFNATVAENIAYGRPLVGADVERAARIANAEAFIKALPAGYETSIGERGIRLSGGQRQRIALARALYARPAILVLDEATSALDSESEREVQSAIDQALEGTTAVIVAHRLSTVQRADLIVVLEAGVIETAGRHEELLERSPLYKRLHAAQLRDEPVAGQ